MVLCLLLLGSEDGAMYMFNSTGLFPAPLARNAKVTYVNKVRSKFRLLGKFMAKALMDSRVVSCISLSLLSAVSLLCAQAHIFIYFSKSGRGFGRFGEISPFVGFGPQTTLDGK